MKTRTRVIFAGVMSAFLFGCGGGGGGGPAPTTPPPAATYSLSANVSGLSGTGLSLTLNGGSPIPVKGNGSITLGTDLAGGAKFQVTVAGSPINPAQTCTTTGASGTVQGASVSVSVTCTTDASQPSVSTAMDSALPPATAKMIAQVQTVGGSGSLGAWVARGVPDTAGETLILGLNTDGHLVAANLTTDFHGTFTADSTALCLVRLMIADLPTQMTANQLNVAIRGTSTYAALVSAIGAALTAQRLPLSDAVVVAALTQVANMVAQTTTALPAQKRVKQTIAVGPWESGNQFTIIPGGPVFLVSVAGTHTAGLFNELAIPWSVNEYASSSADPSAQVGTSITLKKGGLGGIFSVSEEQVAMNNSTFTMELTQTGDTLSSISNDFATALFEGFAGVVTSQLKLPPSCVNLALPVIQKVVSAAANQGAPQDPFVLAKKVITPQLLTSAFSKCQTTLTPDIGAIYSAISELWIDYVATAVSSSSGIVLKGLNALGVAQEAVAGEIYWNRTYTVKICTASDWAVHMCLAAMSVESPPTDMAPGATFTGNILGTASGGGATLLPANLTVDTSSASLTATVQDAQIILTAAESSSPPSDPITVTLTDPATGITANFSVLLSLPILQPPHRVLTPLGSDSTFTIELIAPNGNPILVPSNIRYQTTAVSTQFSFQNASGSESRWTIPANAHPFGNFDVIATDPVGIDYPTLTLTLASVPAVELSADPTAVDPNGTSTISWVSTNATSCSATEGWTASTATSGSASTEPLSKSTTYTMTCRDDTGQVSAPATVTVTVNPPMLVVYQFYNPQSQVGAGIDIVTPISIPITGSTTSSSCVPNLVPPCSSTTSPINSSIFGSASAGYSGTQIGTIVNNTALYNPSVCSVGKKWIARPTYSWKVVENDGLPNKAGCSGAGYIRTRSGTVALNANGDLAVTLLWDDANHWTCPNTPSYSETNASDNHFTSSYGVNLNTGTGSYSETTVNTSSDNITALVANLKDSSSSSSTNDGGSANWPAGTPLDNVGLVIVRSIPSTDPVPAECTAP